jgi:phosphoglycolate phosphatase-like HAD superfamily hydrolase
VIGLLSGGFGRQELEDAGAILVCDDASELVRRLDDLLVRHEPDEAGYDRA